MKALTRRAFVAAPLVFALAGVAMTAQRGPSSATPAASQRVGVRPRHLHLFPTCPSWAWPV